MRQLKPMTDALNRTMTITSNLFMRFAYQVVIQLQRFWKWWQAIPKPHIPLSPFQWMLLIYATIVTLFIIVTPPLEAADESLHLSRILNMREGIWLAPLNADERLQPIDLLPPAYHAFATALTIPFSFDDISAYAVPNPYFNQTSQALGNLNVYLRPLETPASATPIYLLRALNALIGGLLLWVVSHIARLLAPQRAMTSLMAVAFVALNPMFLFFAGAINNLPLVMLLNSILIYFALRTLIYGFSPRRTVFLAIALALALLADVSAWFILMVIMVGAFWIASRDKTWRAFALFALSLLITSALAGGWWLAYNLQTFGEPFATTTFIQTIGTRTTDIDLSVIWATYQQFRLTFWGVFGTSTILAPVFWYGLVDMVVFIAILGLTFLILQLQAIRDFSYARRELTGVLGALILLSVCLIASAVMAFQVQSPRGYWLFSLMGVLAPLLAIGTVEVIWWLLFTLSPPERAFVRAGDAVTESIQRTTYAWLIAFMAFIVLTLPFAVIAPAYASLPTLDNLPERAQIAYADYGAIELIGYEITDRRYMPTEFVPITLYWRTQDEAPPPDLMLSLAFVNARGTQLAKLDTLPGAGRFPTDQWQPNTIYADEYALRLSPFIELPQTFTLDISWWDRTSQTSLQARTREGAPIPSMNLHVGAVVPPLLRYMLNDYIQLPVERLVEAHWDNQIKLLAFDYNSEINELELFWEVISQPHSAYTAFAHIYNLEGDLVGQADVHPDLPTNYWQHAEQYTTRHFLPANTLLPAGDYTIKIGWYALNGERIPLPNPDYTDEAPPPTHFTLFTYTLDEAGAFTSAELDAIRALSFDESEPLPVPQPDITAEPESP